jgi:uncharacterized membrane protein YhaH (DUF805 family)
MLGWTEEVSSVVSGVADLALLLPNASVTARRLHDVGKSGWWMFIPLTIVGIVPYLYWLCKPGNPDTNEYGPAPNMGVASAALVPQHV